MLKVLRLIIEGAVVQCDCGEVKEVRRGNLKNGSTLSCGCMIRKKTSARSTTHGDARSHRLTLTYKSWRAMLDRCGLEAHEAFARYGGAGIRVCDRWLESYENFKADMGTRPSKNHSLDRKDNKGNYEPGNCRWATRSQQGRNKSSNRMLEIDGLVKCVAEWAEISGISTAAIYSRLKLGWNAKNAVFTDVKRVNR